MKIRFVLIAVASLVSGCAWQMKPQQVGPDTYQVSANASPVRGSTTGARKLALESANKQCSSMNKQIQVMDEKTGYAFPTNGTVTITFKCQ